MTVYTLMHHAAKQEGITFGSNQNSMLYTCICTLCGCSFYDASMKYS